jgi:hypothetical protein
VRLEGLGKLNNPPLIGIRTRYLPACSIVLQPTTLRRVPCRLSMILLLILLLLLLHELQLLLLPQLLVVTVVIVALAVV